jgi:hypothetical protein
MPDLLEVSVLDLIAWAEAKGDGGALPLCVAEGDGQVGVAMGGKGVMALQAQLPPPSLWLPLRRWFWHARREAWAPATRCEAIMGRRARNERAHLGEPLSER